MSNRLFAQIAVLILLAGAVYWGVSRILDWQRHKDMQEVISRTAPPLNELISPYPAPEPPAASAVPPAKGTVNEVLEEAEAALKESERAKAEAENALRNAR